MEKFELQMLRAIPIEDLASRLGLDVTHHKALCPFHNDHHASLSFNVRRNTYRCFVCDAHGDTIDLVRHLLNKDFQQACLYLQLQATPTPKANFQLSILNSQFPIFPTSPSTPPATPPSSTTPTSHPKHAASSSTSAASTHASSAGAASPPGATATAPTGSKYLIMIGMAS